MRGIQKETDQPKNAQEREDRVLSESYYQRAEYYLHAMNYPSDSIPAAATRPSVKKLHPNTQAKPQEGKILPFRGSFLRRTRRTNQG